jgi:TonB-linked SusC/RagA family outer membrane protein
MRLTASCKSCSAFPAARSFFNLKLLLIMKFIAGLLLIACLTASAKGLSQGITLDYKNAPLEQVLSAIKKQTGYTFLYKDEVISSAKKVDVSIANASLESALAACFKGQPLSYKIFEKTIVVREKEGIQNAKPVIQNSEPPPIDITGKIINENGEPVRATIFIKGTFIGVASNDKGEFELKGVDENAVLVITAVGIESQEVKVQGRKKLTINVRTKAQGMDAVEITVNTGYQRIRPEQSTGAVSKISTKEYETRVSTDFISGLVNRLPGLMINNDISFNSNANGVTSSNSLFNIRGISTMTGNQNPLIVVDGYPTELTLDMINPNEIESVTVLKDAAASTIYGVRASNGVIIIDRKKAVAGKARFSFRATTSLTPRENYSRYRWDDEGSKINIDYNREVKKTSVNQGSWGQMLRPPANTWDPISIIMAQSAAGVITQEQAEARFAEMASYNNVDDYSRLFLRNAITQTYNVDVSGGVKGALYYFTANYSGSRLQQKNNTNGRFQLTGRTTLSLSQKLSLELTTDFQEGQTNVAPIPGITTLMPYERLQDPTGAPLSVTTKSMTNPYYNEMIIGMGLLDNRYYPLVDMNEISDKNRTTNYRITGNFIYNIFNGFKLHFGGVYESSKADLRHHATELSSEARQYVNQYTQLNAAGALVYNVPRGGFLQQQLASTNGYTVRAHLNYDKLLNKDHSINGIIGAEVRSVVDQQHSAAYFGYNDQTLQHHPVNYATLANGFSGGLVSGKTISYSNLFNQDYVDNRYLSGYSNIVYSFRNKYSATASARIDQSNLFGTNPKYKYKPLWSVGAAWNMHKEEFIKDLVWVNQLKLRVAKGFNGNVAKMSLPQVIAKAASNTTTVPASAALIRAAFANSSLRWEQTDNFNAGLDFTIFKNIRGGVDYYTKKSTDLLGNTQIDPTIGAGPTLINSASINNRGLEFSLHADWISKRRFNWNTGFVLSKNISKVLDVFQEMTYSPSNLNGAGFIEGYPLGPVFAYRWAGLSNQGYPQVVDDKGNVTTSNQNGNNNVLFRDTSTAIRYMGTSLPKRNIGLSNRIDVGDFYFFCMVNYYGGFKVFAPRPALNGARPLEGASNYWKQPGDENYTEVMSTAAFNSLYGPSVYNFSDARVVNGDYITLADVTVSYNLGRQPIFQKAGFSNFEIKLQASNLYTIGLNEYNYSKATGSYDKPYITPTYTIALFTNF